MGQLVRVPASETQRLLAVRSLNAIHSSPTPELAILAELARGVFETPYAAINIIDEDWQRIAGQAGLKIAECSRDMSICTRVVFDDEMLVIPDLADDPELGNFSFVIEDPRFRFYAGAPVRLEGGLPVGAFCILDQKPRQFSPDEEQKLTRFAQIAGALLRLQKTNLLMGIAENGLRTAAMTDPLTRFLNRSALEAIVDGALSMAVSTGRHFRAHGRRRVCDLRSGFARQKCACGPVRTVACRLQDALCGGRRVYLRKAQHRRCACAARWGDAGVVVEECRLSALSGKGRRPRSRRGLQRA